jgi:glycine oxidase
VPSPAQAVDVVVVGGGLIGTSIAWRLAQAGVAVAVVTGERTAAASQVAAGMLAPVSETTFTDQTLLPLNVASLRRYADFAAELESATSLPAGLRQSPTLSVAYDADDAARLRAFADFLDRTGLRCERLTGRDCRGHEPLLAPAIQAGLLVAEDWSCDNRLLLRALVAAARQAGVREVTGFVHAVTSLDGRVTGVERADGSAIAATQVVIANGAWAAQIAGVPVLPVRPVKGQILRLDPGRLTGPTLTVRAFTRGSEVYLVPRDGGRELVVGATVEELGFDHRVTAGGVYELLRDARTVLPLTAEYALTETAVGWRPGTPDNAPILGRCELDGLLLATGHYRNGVLLTPITAEVIAKLVTSDELDPIAAGFGLDRFAPGGAGGSSPLESTQPRGARGGRAPGVNTAPVGEPLR